MNIATELYEAAGEVVAVGKAEKAFARAMTPGTYRVIVTD